MKELLNALHKFHKECPPVVKDSNNPFFKSKYATLDAIQEHIRPHLINNGLVISQACQFMGDGVPYVRTSVFHVETSQHLESDFPIVVGKATAQEYGSAVSYAKRYSLSGLLNLTIQDEDDDGNKATFGNTTPQTVKTTAQDNGKPWLNESHASWGKVVEALKNGSTMTDVRKKFNVSKAIEAKLTA